MLNEKEKRTLSWMLKEKINNTFELEKKLRNELSEITEETPKTLLSDMLNAVYNERTNCYEIARKLDIR